MAAQRPIWRGHLRLALVSCPVALYSARHERGSLHFNLLNPKTGNRIRMVTQDSETGDELSRRDLVKGYQVQKDRYVIVTDEDFESARVAASSTLNVEKFVPLDSIDPIYFDSSYYVVPDGDAGLDVYVVLRTAIAEARELALSRVVIAQRERAIALMPMGNGMVAHTLHENRDLNDAGDLFSNIPDAKADPEMVSLATQLIERQTGRYDAADIEDRYETRLRAVIEAKAKGEGLAPEPEDASDQGNVIDLMAALRRSLGQAPAEKPSARSAKKPSAAKAKPQAGKPEKSARKPAKPLRKRA
jgi:DNA end-binding protein Ku